MLNDYDAKIKQQIAITKKSDGIVPNLILTNVSDKIKNKGFTYGSSSAYFSSEQPNLENEYLDIRINFSIQMLLKILLI